MPTEQLDEDDAWRKAVPIIPTTCSLGEKIVCRLKTMIGTSWCICKEHGPDIAEMENINKCSKRLRSKEKNEDNNSKGMGE